MPCRYTTAFVRTDSWTAMSPSHSEIGTMQAHKFRIGQIVTYSPAVRGQDAPAGPYMIIVRLPQRSDGEFEYRIRNVNEQHERIAQESELRGR
jgi:hypothetical protein